MSNIEWGPEIEVNGERPAWLGDGDKFNWLGCAYVGTSHHWEGVSSIRLPADHWAYAAISAGFEPWGGGDGAPEDWDGGEVLYRDGEADRRIKDLDWYRDSTGKQYGQDIIGYRKKSETQTADTVTIQRMTKDQCITRFGRRLPFEVMRDLGLIKPEPTKAERIAADTGIDLETVERVLAAAS